MNLKDNPLMKIIDSAIKGLVGYGDEAYKKNWLFYLIVGLIIFMVIILIYN